MFYDFIRTLFSDGTLAALILLSAIEGADMQLLPSSTLGALGR